MKTRIFSASDYAGIETGDLYFYYGYEVKDELTDEWCFKVEQKDKEIFRLTKTQIEKQTEGFNSDEPMYYVTAGIGIWLVQNTKIISNKWQ